MAGKRTLPARMVERAQIVLRAAGDWKTGRITQLMGITPEKVARWRNRFLEGGMVALEKDAPRSGRTRSITDRWVKKVLDMTLRQKRTHATHWSTRTMAMAGDVGDASVRRI